ncbi:hypothetical protein Tfu_0506 [Thermobifida fusca YX]|uniref:MucB/RseB N-terminal domain-containing protein n=1 Tax=Thermobifida fusca (strain YX) TaxID=269800 RepID=Q47SM3_THEFY|nr:MULTISPECIES: sigma-E factor regulatory protein RseB domain-containing protein [Thermobifida]AAZ54544.1 hypothetical protein Tfu_0506 [Thermobifida fusca YX]MBO2529593.1 hypothetical protein [Thermobifida sp.]MDD6793168.1 sigma-E factor regulatory protein RseB domain-containing protein [Thermobifida fusca]PPS93408.1 hypothetical protein BH05_07960 [Thermobifida fusca]PZN60344.1 MAG: hypothetical protein DIU53_15330 [Thermobifida fusca]
MSGGRDTAGPRWRAPATAAVLCLLLCLVSVAVVGDSADRPAGRRGGDGMAVLRRAAETSVRLSYQGVRVVSWVDSTGRTETARLNILHQPGVGTLVSPLHDTGEGTNLLVGSTPWGRVGKDVLDVLETNFWVRTEGETQIGQRSAVGVVAQRDNGQVAARFWTDEHTGLLLRREVYDISGEVAQTSVFESIQFGVDAAALAEETRQPDVVSRPWGDELDPQELRQLRDEGWVLPERLLWGFELVEARATGEGDERITHLTYSDGISVISVFTQRGSLGGAAVTGLRRTEEDGALVHVADEGGQHQRIWEADGFVHTVLADAPAGLVADVLHALPPPDRHGFWERVGRGFERVGTWLD